MAEPLDLSHHFSRVTKSRGASAVKDFYRYFRIPNIGNLAGGLPNNNYFPFDTLEGATALADRFEPTPNQPVGPPSESGAQSTAADGFTASQVVVPKVSNNTDLLRKIDLKTALQYGTAQGYPPLYSFLRQFARENMHPNVPYVGGPEIILTCGNTDGFSKTIEALSNVWDAGYDAVEYREGILFEEFCYMGAIQTVRPRGLNIVPVTIDNEGMKATGKGGLEDVLESWDNSKGKRPHLMYTVTIGQNPTSGTLGVERRKEIYALCSKYDIIIVEDDPYWYLQYPSAHASSMAAWSQSTPPGTLPGPQNFNSPRSSGYPFLDSLVPSYLSVDTDGRVVRLDTFSKTVAPGCRLGWITAQPALCERLMRITESSTQQPSGFVQSIIAEMIIGPQNRNGRSGGKDDRGWKTDGWVRWLEGLRGSYERRMQTMCNILDAGKQLFKTGRRRSMSEEWSVVDTVPIFDFIWPAGGMFVWIRLNLQTHPLWKQASHEKLARGLWIHLTTPKYLVIVAPGSLFAPTEEIREGKSFSYFRICFAAVEEPDVAPMSHRFVEGCRSFWAKKKLDDIDEDMVEDVEQRLLAMHIDASDTMIEDIKNEIEAINSIYGEHTLGPASNPAAPDEYMVTIPQREVTLRLSIPDQYPDKGIHITAIEGVGPTSPKGFGNHVLTVARDVLQRVFTPGQVCLFDMLQELEQILDQESSVRKEQDAEQDQRPGSGHKLDPETSNTLSSVPPTHPQWALSSTMTEKKSVFLARACLVNSTIEARAAVAHLLSTDKRASKATHNISAYRIRTLAKGNEVVYQDCDDDGEDAAGGRLLRLLQVMDIWNMVVVVSRWYGGVKLGPARFGIINAVAHEAVVAAELTRDWKPHH
ncbi:MAG: hypothetical protein Q9201_005079 [Fulgogasparrea decipioides]